MNRRRTLINNVLEALRASGQQQWTTGEVLKVISAQGARPWATLNHMSGPGGELKYVGTDRKNGHWELA